jgi:hypothetical protein
VNKAERTTVSLPTDLAEWARQRSDGNVSGYVAGLIARDKKRAMLMSMFQQHGYVGDKAITDEGIAAMGERLHTLNARRARRRSAA